MMRRPLFQLLLLISLLAVLSLAAGPCLAQPATTVDTDTEQGNQPWNWATRAARQGNTKAQEHLAVWYYFGTYGPKNYRAAVNWALRARDEGSELVRKYFADILLDGKGESSTIEQLRWLRLGADLKNPVAMETLGEKLFFGQDVPRDVDAALIYLTPLAENGSARAQYLLGLAYAEGAGVPCDYPKSVKLLQQAADQGLINAQEEIGICYARGQGLPQNDTTAITLLRQAADRGGEKARSFLWKLWQEERVKPESASEGRLWLKAAAQLGNPAAQTGYGDLWYQRDGVPGHITPFSGFRMAAFWYWKAARQDYAPAQYKLAQMFNEGKGEELDVEEAWALASLAARQNNAEAQALKEKLVSQMTAPELAQARKHLDKLAANRIECH